MTCTGCEERRELIRRVYEAQQVGDYAHRDELLRQIMGSMADDIKATRDAVINKFRRGWK